MLAFLSALKPSTIIYSLVFAAIVGAGLKYHSLSNEVDSLTKKNIALTTDNSILTENNKVLKSNMQVLVTANNTNLETVKQLDLERAASKNAIASLAIANKRDRDTLNNINKKIEEMMKDPKNDGEVSPILRTVIKDIQSNRESK